MSYDLLNFRQEIDNILDKGSIEEIDFAQLKADLGEKSSAIFTSIHDRLSGLGPENGKLYLRQHQTALSVILDDLDSAISQSPQGEMDKGDLLTTYRWKTEALLCSLERHFPYYFDYSTTPHHSRVKNYRLKCKETATECLSILAERELPAEAFTGFSQLLSGIQDEDKTPTYKSISYLEGFFERLNKCLSSHDGPLETLDIILTVISLDFNHPLFYHFACGYFGAEIEKCENINGQYQTLNFLKKLIRQVLNFSPAPYNENQPPIADSLQRYLDAEIDYLRSLELTGEDLSTGGLLDKAFKVTFTVRQLALFIHLQVDAGIIAVQSPKGLHQYAARHYSTVEKNTISAKSFKNAYYGNTEKDREKVLEKIASMLAIAREKY